MASPTSPSVASSSPAWAVPPPALFRHGRPVHTPIARRPASVERPHLARSQPRLTAAGGCHPTSARPLPASPDGTPGRTVPSALQGLQVAAVAVGLLFLSTVTPPASAAAAIAAPTASAPTTTTAAAATTAATSASASAGADTPAPALLPPPVRPAPAEDESAAAGSGSPRPRVPAPIEHVSGAARVVDGDTLVIGSTRVRLLGIDAPEMSQTCTGRTGPYSCGVVAKDALDAKIGGRQVSCAGRGRDRYGRFVGICVVQEGAAGARQEARVGGAAPVPPAVRGGGVNAVATEAGAGPLEGPAGGRQEARTAAAPPAPRGVNAVAAEAGAGQPGVVDLNGWMVSQGHALAYVDYSKRYVTQEQDAHAAHVGVWVRGDDGFEKPWAYRAARRAERDAAKAQQAQTAQAVPAVAATGTATGRDK